MNCKSFFLLAGLLAFAVALAPSAIDDVYLGTANTALVVDAASGVLANDADPESDPFTAVLGTDAMFGTLQLNADGSFTFTPDSDFVGETTFTYTATDGTLSSSEATVSITIQAQPTNTQTEEASTEETVATSATEEATSEAADTSADATSATEEATSEAADTSADATSATEEATSEAADTSADATSATEEATSEAADTSATEEATSEAADTSADATSATEEATSEAADTSADVTETETATTPDNSGTVHSVSLSINTPGKLKYTIWVGDSMEFTNDLEENITITFDDEMIGDITLAPGQSAAVLFPSVGKYAFRVEVIKTPGAGPFKGKQVKRKGGFPMPGKKGKNGSIRGEITVVGPTDATDVTPGKGKGGKGKKAGSKGAKGFHW